MANERGNTHTEDDDEQEVNIGHIVKLVVQVLRDEAERSVLCCPDLVPSKSYGRLAVLVSLVRRRRYVDIDPPSFGLIRGIRGLAAIGEAAGVGPPLLVL